MGGTATLQLAKDAKHYVENDRLDYLKELVETAQAQIQARECYVNFEYVFQQAYLHACLKRKQEMIAYLTELYETFGPVEKAALKPNFIYGKYLAKR